MKNTDKTYPLVVIANGTGITAFKYKAVFKHLASWGFIAIGNEDKNTRSGVSTAIEPMKRRMGCKRYT